MVATRESGCRSWVRLGEYVCNLGQLRAHQSAPESRNERVVRPLGDAFYFGGVRSNQAPKSDNGRFRHLTASRVPARWLAGCSCTPRGNMQRDRDEAAVDGDGDVTSVRSLREIGVERRLWGDLVRRRT